MDEVEVTEEMVEDGSQADLMSLDRSPEAVYAAVYRAMRALEPPQPITRADVWWLALSALMKAQAALNPLSVFLRRPTPEMERYLESVRDEIRNAVQLLEDRK